MKFLAVFFVALVLAHSLSARDIYAFDPAHSSIAFIAHQYLGSTTGKFSEYSGTIEIDREHPENSLVNARIRVKSIDTGIRKRDDHLLSPEFFDENRFPEITFKSRAVRQTGAQTGDITGEFTMHGVTRGIVLHARLLTLVKPGESPPRTRWVIITESLKRHDFNLVFSKTAETVSGIGQDVAVKLEIEASKTGSR
jgi:polyisoprenoid-binding protein YceI